MALATRCPQCGSVFRVVADQLKLRGGLVRCGQCNAVFDAIGSLTYLDDAQLRNLRAETSAPPPQLSAESAAAAETETLATRSPAEPEPAQSGSALPSPQAPAATATDAAPPLPAHAAAAFRELALALATTPPPASASAPGASDVADRADGTEPAPFEATAALATSTAVDEQSQASQSALPAEDSARGAAAEPADASGHPPPEVAPDGPAADHAISVAASADAAAADAPTPPAQSATPDALPATLAEPEFLRRATQQARARRSRKAWAAACVLAAVVLTGQLLMAFRGEVLMRWPQAQPIYAQVCERLGCTADWPAQSDQIAVLASDLQVLPGRSAYELNVTLRNRAPFPQALPALEVTLTDARGQVIARKVVSVADYRAESQHEPLAPGADLAAKLVFETSGAAPAGFLVYPFHP